MSLLNIPIDLHFHFLLRGTNPTQNRSHDQIIQLYRTELTNNYVFF